MLSYYYPETLKNVTTALLAKFTGMQCYRWNKEHTSVVKIIDVPLTFSPVEKMQREREQDFTVEPESQGQRAYLQVPRIDLTYNGMQYAPGRATGVNEYRYFEDTSDDGRAVNAMFKDYQPAPYDFTFTLSIRSDSMNDYSQIIENIAPYFNPKLYLRVKEFSFLNIERDLQVTLGSIENQFTDELDQQAMRRMDGSVTFTVEGFMYRKVSSAKMVKIVKTQFFVGTEEDYFPDVGFDMQSYAATSAGDVPPDFPTTFQTSGYDANSDSFYTLSAYPLSAAA